MGGLAEHRDITRASTAPQSNELTVKRVGPIRIDRPLDRSFSELSPTHKSPFRAMENEPGVRLAILANNIEDRLVWMRRLLFGKRQQGMGRTIRVAVARTVTPSPRENRFMFNPDETSCRRPH